MNLTGIVVAEMEGLVGSETFTNETLIGITETIDNDERNTIGIINGSNSNSRSNSVSSSNSNRSGGGGNNNTTSSSSSNNNNIGTNHDILISDFLGLESVSLSNISLSPSMSQVLLAPTVTS